MATARLAPLVAAAGTGRPLLAEGLSEDALSSPPEPIKAPRGHDEGRFWDPGADTSDLAHQRWAIVVPDGEHADRLLDAIAPLRRLREAQQDAPASVFRAPPGMDMAACAEWKDRHLDAEDLLE